MGLSLSVMPNNKMPSYNRQLWDYIKRSCLLATMMIFATFREYQYYIIYTNRLKGIAWGWSWIAAGDGGITGDMMIGQFMLYSFNLL